MVYIYRRVDRYIVSFFIIFNDKVMRRFDFEVLIKRIVKFGEYGKSFKIFKI